MEICFLLGSLILIYINVKDDKKTYTDKLERYKQELSKYTYLLKEYKEKMAKYEKEIANLNSPQNIGKYRRAEIKRELAIAKQPKQISEQSPIGKYEEMFLNYLYKWFPQKILKNMSPNLYVPDFVYVDMENNLYIDIEIDEPYISTTKEPIHYTGNKDEKRNYSFISENWLVIRFAEEQIVKYPDSCCKFISKVISEILDDKNILDEFQGIPNLKPVETWSYEEAITLGKNNYRNSYAREKYQLEKDASNDNWNNEYDEDVESYDEDAETYYNRALAYYKQGIYAGAISNFTGAIRLHPKYKEVVYNNRGNAYYKKGLYDRAISDYTSAIAINPEFMKAYYNRGIVYKSKGLYAIAGKDFARAKELELLLK